MEQDHHLLFVAGKVILASNDQWGGKQGLLLKCMRMHPMGARIAKRKYIVPLLGRFEQRCRQIWHSVHWPGRRQSVPVNQSLFTGVVREHNIEVVFRV